MSNKAKIQIGVTIFLGLVFLGIGIYNWYDLYQYEQGNRTTQLSFILAKIYNVAGKWGVAGFYSLFTVYCFWRAGVLIKLAKSYDESNEED